MTGQLVQRLSNVGVLQTSLTLHEPVPSDGVGSAYFNGSATMHVTSDLNDFAVGTGDFTVEWWQNMTVDPASSRVWSIGNNPATIFAVSIDSNGTVFWFYVGGSAIIGTGITSVVGAWHHFAVVRRLGTTFAYLDGAQIGSSATGYNIVNNFQPLYIGDEESGGNPFNGYITNFQWCTGTALYTGPFTPPEVPTTAGANSKLLLLCDSAATLTTDSSGTNKTVVNGGATWSNSVPPVAAQPTGISNTYVYADTFDEVSLAPTILGDSLHAWFDAGNRASYPGTGVIWYDISGNGFSGIFTLIGPPGSPEPQGLFFNGFSSKIDLNVSNPYLPMTLSFWVKPDNAFQLWGIYDSAPGQPHVLRQTHAGAPNNTAEWWDGDPYVSTGLSPGSWQYLTVVYHATTGFRSVDTYVNGVPVDSGTGSPYIYYAWTSMVLGCINNSTNWYSGSMGQAQFYSRKMTQEEIAWNYSVDAVRYGLTPSVDIYRNLPPGPTMPQPVAQRQVNDGTLQVKTEFDEVTLSTPTVSGLLVWLDANDSRSYSGSGSTWYDISGNHYDFTLYNSPAFTSGTASYLSFVRNSLQYGDRPGIGDLNSWTIEIWLKISEPLSLVEATAAITTVYDVPGGAHPGVINYCLGTFNGGPSNALTNGFYTGGLWINTSGFTPTIGDWYQVVGTYDGNDLVEYVNGAVLSAASYNWTAVSNGGGIRIARRWDGPLSAIHMFPGSISIARIYDRALNAAEVAHNFAVDHSRFGI